MQDTKHGTQDARASKKIEDRRGRRSRTQLNTERSGNDRQAGPDLRCGPLERPLEVLSRPLDRVLDLVRERLHRAHGDTAKRRSKRESAPRSSQAAINIAAHASRHAAAHGGQQATAQNSPHKSATSGHGGTAECPTRQGTHDASGGSLLDP
jgi:hypothetical protein